MDVLSLQRLKFSLQSFPPLIKQSLVLFIVLEGINFFFNQIMVYLQAARMTSKEDFFVPLIIFLAFVGFIVQSTVKVVWILVVCRFFNGKNKNPDMEDLSTYLWFHVEHGLIESMRAFLKSVLYGFLFIVPGVLKMIRYQFVVFVAAESRYQEGHIEALKASERISSGKTLPLFGLVLIFAVFGFFTTSNELLIDAPISVLSMEVVTIGLTTLECLYLYFLYNDLKKDKGLQA